MAGRLVDWLISRLVHWLLVGWVVVTGFPLHVVAVAGGGPVAAVVDAVAALHEAEAQHRRHVPAAVERVRAGVVPRTPHLATLLREEGGGSSSCTMF